MGHLTELQIGSNGFFRRLFQHMGEASKVEALKIASNAGVAPSAANASAAPASAAAAAGSTAQKTPASLATLKAAQAAPRCLGLSSLMQSFLLVLLAWNGHGPLH